MPTTPDCNCSHIFNQIAVNTRGLLPNAATGRDESSAQAHAARICVDTKVLRKIAASFDETATDTKRTIIKLREAMSLLQVGDWIGKGANAFYEEMERFVFVALTKLLDALYAARDVILVIIQLWEVILSDCLPGGIIPTCPRSGGGSGGYYYALINREIDVIIFGPDVSPLKPPDTCRCYPKCACGFIEISILPPLLQWLRDIARQWPRQENTASSSAVARTYT